MGKRSRKHRDHINEDILDNETQDIIETEEDKNRRQKKVLSHNFHNVKQVKPLTAAQERAFRSYWEGKNLLLHGTAGTGKSYVAIYLGLNDLLKGMYERIVIVRSAVQSRDVGFLPGTLSEKMSLYETPYRDIFGDILGRRDAYDLLKKKEHLEFMSTSFVRGLTMDNALIILDEAQNCSFHEVSSVLTRVGENSKVIVCGDSMQNDLAQQGKKSQESGFNSMIEIAKKMPSFDIIKFTPADIVRSGFCREFILAKIDLGLE